MCVCARTRVLVHLKVDERYLSSFVRFFDNGTYAHCVYVLHARVVHAVRIAGQLVAIDALTRL